MIYKVSSIQQGLPPKIGRNGVHFSDNWLWNLRTEFHKLKSTGYIIETNSAEYAENVQLNF